MRRFIAGLLVVGGIVAVGACEPVEQAPGEPRAASGTPSGSPSESASATPSVQVRTVTEQQKIPYTTRRVKDASLAAGTTRVRRQGVVGIKASTYRVTLTDGVETGKKLVRERVLRKPVGRIVVVGTKPARSCDPNYNGACVPIASDVDCAGGSGDGPGYVSGPVRVIGDDIYDLDRDGDGIACDT